VKRNPALIKTVKDVARGNTFWEEDPVGDLLIFFARASPLG
jgi:hypothetical protein